MGHWRSCNVKLLCDACKWNSFLIKLNSVIRNGIGIIHQMNPLCPLPLKNKQYIKKNNTSSAQKKINVQSLNKTSSWWKSNLSIQVQSCVEMSAWLRVRAVGLRDEMYAAGVESFFAQLNLTYSFVCTQIWLNKPNKLTSLINYR